MSPAGAGRPGTGGAVARVAIVGLGAIGQEVLKAVAARPGLRLVSVADPAFVGRDAGEVAGIEPLGVAVTSTYRSSGSIPSGSERPPSNPMTLPSADRFTRGGQWPADEYVICRVRGS